MGDLVKELLAKGYEQCHQFLKTDANVPCFALFGSGKELRLEWIEPEEGIVGLQSRVVKKGANQHAVFFSASQGSKNFLVALVHQNAERQSYIINEILESADGLFLAKSLVLSKSVISVDESNWSVKGDI